MKDKAITLHSSMLYLPITAILFRYNLMQKELFENDRDVCYCTKLSIEVQSTHEVSPFLRQVKSTKA